MAYLTSFFFFLAGILSSFGMGWMGWMDGSEMWPGGCLVRFCPAATFASGEIYYFWKLFRKSKYDYRVCGDQTPRLFVSVVFPGEIKWVLYLTRSDPGEWMRSFLGDPGSYLWGVPRNPCGGFMSF